MPSCGRVAYKIMACKLQSNRISSHSLLKFGDLISVPDLSVLFLQSVGATDVQVSINANCVLPRKCSSTVSPCLNDGSCRDLDGSSFTCECTEAYYGSGCQFYNICAVETPCMNGATCEQLNGSGRGYQCVCGEGFSGPSCEVPLM